MAFALPLLASAGGGSALAGGVALAGAAVGVYSAVQQRQVGQDQKAQLNADAKTEAVSAQQREIERRRNLIRALSSQNAAAGAGGIETSGSIASIMRRDINDNQNDLLSASINSQARQRALRSQGSNAARVANAGAATSLLDTAEKTYKTLGGGAKKKP